LTISEKLYCRGVSALNDVELLQVIIGGRDAKIERTAKALLRTIDKVGAEKLTAADVKAVKGVGDARADAILAAVEFWRRKFVKQTRPLIDSPEKAAEQLMFLSDKTQEHFVVLTLDGARRLIKTRVVSIGTLTSAPVHPREVFAPAIEDRAASIIVAHNHPSGSLHIGDKDKEVTRRMRQSGELLGIRVDDHIVIADGDFVSVREADGWSEDVKNVAEC
jgi:DNA repair protein RadC